MESNKSIDEIFQELKTYIDQKPTIIDQDKVEFIEKINNLVLINEKKINPIFFGAMSSGKTLSINLLLKYFHEKSKQIENLNESKKSTEEDEFFSLMTSDVENTYYFIFIEKSPSDHFEVIWDIKDEDERKIISESKKFDEINEKNQIILKYSNSNDGIIQINKFLAEVHDISMIFIGIKRENETKKQNSKIRQEDLEKSEPSVIKIKIPNFPEEFRIVDTPGISLKYFSNNFVKVFSEFIYINVIIFIQDILKKVVDDHDSEIFNMVNKDYGKPFVYSFHTKGLNFVKQFEFEPNNKISKEKLKENITNRKKYGEFNYLYFSRIKEFKNKEIYFRKIIPIINNDYENEEVRKNLDIFIGDVKKTVEEFGHFNFELCLKIKLRRIIFDLNDKLSKKFILSQDEILYLNGNKDDSIKNYQDALREYFLKYDTFQNYRNLYPDHLNKLNEIYKKNRLLNKNYWNRSNYIEKHAELAFEEFQDLILVGVKDLWKKHIELFVESIEKSIFEKINLRLNQEGILGIDNLFDYHWIIKKILSFFYQIFKFNNYIPIWTYDGAKEDISKLLFESIINNMGEYLIRFNEE